MTDPSRLSASLSRRSFLGRLAALGAAGFGAASLLAACGGGEEPPGAQIRRSLGYVDDSSDPDRLCSNCRFFNSPAHDAAPGGCQLFEGPVAPGGYCNSWAAPPA